MPLILFSEENRKRDSSTRKKHARYYKVEQQKEKSELPTHSILAKKKESERETGFRQNRF